MNVMTVFGQVLVMFALMALGYLATKLKILAKDTTRDLTVFIISFVIPAVIISAFLKPMEHEGLSDLVWSFGLNILYFMVIIFLNPRLFSSRLVPNPVRRMQMRYAFTFSNNGFIISKNISLNNQRKSIYKLNEEALKDKNNYKKIYLSVEDEE